MTSTIRKTPGGISYMLREGAGPTVVFLHGIGSNATSFVSLFDLLPEHLNVVAWNAPGYMTSDPLGAPWPLPQDYATALGRFLDDLGLSAVHLVGHSLGTLIAASFAWQYPHRVQSLVLSSAANGYKIPPGAPLPAKLTARTDDLSKMGSEAFARARAANLVHEPGDNAEITQKVEVAMAMINPDGYAQAVRLLASGDLPGDLAKVPFRPGFIIGAEDRVTPITQTKTAAAAWEKAQGAEPTIIEIAEAGHAVYLQKPEEFTRALLSLLPDECAAPPNMTQKREDA